MILLTEQHYVAAHKRQAAIDAERKAALAKVRIVVKAWGNSYRVQFTPHATQISPSVSVWISGPRSHWRQLRDHGIAYAVQLIARRKLKLTL
jgi:hypothetical protein